MLKNIWFENWKSYVRGDLPLAGLTVLLGANASGKSNALEALQLLTWIADGFRLETLFGFIEERRLSVRGAPIELLNDARAPLSLGCTVAFDDVDLDLTLKLQLGDNGLRIVNEVLWRSGDNLALYEVAQPASEYTNQVQVRYNNFARGKNKPQIPAIDQQAIFTQLTTPARFDAGHGRSQQEIPAAAGYLQRTLAGVLFLDPAPSRMRDYSFVVDSKKLRGDGSNLSAVLNHLCQDAERKREVLEFVRSLPEQDLVSIGFITGPRGEVMVELTESFGGRSRGMSARLLSDGTLRVLAIAAALLSVAEGSLVVIEEIDNGVHPSRARALLETITRIATVRGLRVLLTTHNPALIDAVPDDAVKDVVACYRDPGDGASRLLRLGDLEAYPELVAQGPLGALVTRGILDRALKAPAGPATTPDRMQNLLRILEKAP